LYSVVFLFVLIKSRVGASPDVYFAQKKRIFSPPDTLILKLNLHGKDHPHGIALRFKKKLLTCRPRNTPKAGCLGHATKHPGHMPAAMCNLLKMT
jgi:hypothetical protein